tara:strand:- start:32861 stop:33949 length:1089 start_codon:yes stop_codon:yes gene_type:complete
MLSLLILFLNQVYSSDLNLHQRLTDFQQASSLEASLPNHPHQLLHELASSSLDMCEQLEKLSDKELILLDPYIEEFQLLPCFPSLMMKIEKYHTLQNTNILAESMIVEMGLDQLGITSQLSTIEPVGEMQPPFFSGYSFVNTDKGEVVYRKNLITGEYPNMSLEQGEIVFTFDDGPSPRITPLILDILANHQIKAVFFQIGNKSLKHKEWTQEVVKQGHILASHSYSHRSDLYKIPFEKAREDIDQGHKEVFYNSGSEDAAFFRYPYGGRTQKLAQHLYDSKISSFFWNMDSRDWAIKDPVKLYNHCVEQINRNQKGVILFHDIHTQTANIMDLFLKNLKQAGYKIRLAVPLKWKEQYEKAI